MRAGLAAVVLAAVTAAVGAGCGAGGPGTGPLVVKGTPPVRPYGGPLHVRTGQTAGGSGTRALRAASGAADRVLYSFDVGGRTKVAVVVARDRKDRPGRGPETSASRDPAELPERFTATTEWEVLTGRDGGGPGDPALRLTRPGPLRLGVRPLPHPRRPDPRP
ncbi:hypothetical protein [Streptomyces sp. NPDC094031]|uniref:hypothetical protein n=1 Tax=Streptomyces sp. NPDC094031 TaxID=3155307 RepID=UPI0033279BF7